MRRKKLANGILIVMAMLMASGCGKGGKSIDAGMDAGIQILPEKIENVSTEPSVPEDAAADEHDNSKYPIEFLGGAWVLEGFTQNQFEISASKETMVLETADGEKVEVENMPVQLNLMPYKDNPFESCGVGYGEVMFKKTDLRDNYFEFFYNVPVIYDTHENILAFGIIPETLMCENGVFTDETGNAVEELDVEQFTYEMEWSGWNLTLKDGKQEVAYVPGDIDCGEGVSFVTDVIDESGIALGKNLGCQGMAALHENYEGIDDIIRIKPAYEQRDKESIQFHLEKPLYAEYDINDDGTMKINVQDKGEYLYNFLYSGRSLVLMNEGITALYSVYAEKSEASDSSIEFSRLSDLTNDYNILSLAHFETGSHSIYVNDDSLSFWLENGATTSQNLEEMLAPGEMKDIELSLDGHIFTVKIINIYDTHIQYKEANVAGTYFDSQKCNILLGSLGGEGELAYGVSTAQDVIDYWKEIPFEKSEDCLAYKANGLTKIEIPDFSGFFTGGGNVRSTIIEDDHEREIRFLFTDGVLSGIERIAPAMLYSGLQDNIATDELTSLTPSYVADVTVVRDTILDKLKAAFHKADINVNINENTGEIVMPNDILFATDEYELSEKGKKFIDRFMKVYAKVLLNDQFADVISEIAIDGHCDPTGSDAYNQVLSQNRADSVKQWCLDSTTNKLTDKQKQRLSEKAKTKGYSFSDPIYDGYGNVDNEASRRVTIKFFIDMDAAGNAAE